MRAIIRMGHIEAVLENGRWRCDIPQLEHHLNVHRRTTPRLDYSPYPLRWEAESAARAFGAEVVHVDEPPPSPPPSEWQAD